MDNMLILVGSSFFISLGSNLIIKYTTDQHKMKAIKERMDKLRKKMKEKKNDIDTMKKIMDEQNALIKEQLQYSMRSFIYNALFIIPVFWLLKKWLNGFTVKLPFSLPWIGDKVGWLGMYIFYAILFSLLIKRLLKISY